MKRWVAALVTVLFLATAMLHVLAHRGGSDGACAACQMQASSMPAAAAPCVVVVWTQEFVPPRSSAPRAVAARIAGFPARAPPSLPA